MEAPTNNQASSCAEATHGGLLASTNQNFSSILTELDNKIETKVELVPIEVQPTLLSSNSLVSGCTSLGGNSFDNVILKLYLKNLALKIIEEEYEKHRNSSSNLH